MQGPATCFMPIVLWRYIISRRFVARAGWNYYFVTLWAACAIAILLLLPMVNLKNFVQREAAKKAALNKPKAA